MWRREELLIKVKWENKLLKLLVFIIVDNFRDIVYNGKVGID